MFVLMKERKVQPKHYLEYLALRAFCFLANVMPYRGAMVMGYGIAWISHYLFRFRRAEAMRRMRSVLGPALSEQTLRQHCWIAWRNLCFNAVEIIRLPSFQKQDVVKRTNYPEAINSVNELMDGGKGLIIAVCHMGNWDQAGIGLSLLGIPVFFIARRQKNMLTDAYLNRMRGSTGVETIANDSAVLRSVFKRLKKGGALAILPDVRARTKALDITFLGGNANIGAGMALFSRQVGAPILPAVLIRKGWFQHECKVFDPVYPDPSVEKEEDWRRITQTVMNHFDSAIRSHPEQYFWYNKRWVLDPLTETSPS